MPKISVIVPVYNTEQFLPQCIDSILSQTFTDFELILVEDGCTDNSGRICDEYALKDSSIMVIHTKNGGANKARQIGVEAANGEWINFVDSDDTISSDALEILYKNVSQNIDIIIGQIDCQVNSYNGIYKINEYRSFLISSCLPAPVAKLYRKKIFNTFSFSHPKAIKLGEDLLMNIKLAFNTEQEIKIIPNIIYSYFQRINSTVHTFTPSIEYHDLYFKEFLNSIPEELHETYSIELFKHVYNIWSNFYGYKICIPDNWYVTFLNEYLNNNLEQHINILNKLDYKLIKTKNIFIRAILVISKKIYNRIPYAKNIHHHSSI